MNNIFLIYLVIIISIISITNFYIRNKNTIFEKLSQKKESLEKYFWKIATFLFINVYILFFIMSLFLYYKQLNDFYNVNIETPENEEGLIKYLLKCLLLVLVVLIIGQLIGFFLLPPPPPPPPPPG